MRATNIALLSIGSLTAVALASPIAVAQGAFGDCGGAFSIVDLDAEASASTEFSQRVHLDEDNVLLAIVLARTGATGVSFDAIVDRDVRAERVVDLEQDADLDDDDVFAALALGARGLDGDDALGCVSARDLETRTVVAHSQRVHLDEDTVFAAVAFARATGETIDLSDVANYDIDTFAGTEIDSDFDIDREDAILALALGDV